MPTKIVTTGYQVLGPNKGVISTHRVERLYNKAAEQAALSEANKAMYGWERCQYFDGSLSVRATTREEVT